MFVVKGEIGLRIVSAKGELPDILQVAFLLVAQAVFHFWLLGLLLGVVGALVAALIFASGGEEEEKEGGEKETDLLHGFSKLGGKDRNFGLQYLLTFPPPSIPF